MDPNLNDKVKTILTTEVKFVIAVVGFVFGIVTPYYQMRQDVALIKADISNINSNHEVHIQDLTQEIKDLNLEQKAQNDRIIQLQESIIRLQK
jgi:cell division protein FtsL